MDKSVSRQYFNEKAAGWDVTARNNDPARLNALAERLELPKSGWILDVGTGTGVFLPYLQSEDSQVKIVSIDFALNMLRVAQGKQHGPNIQFLCAEVENVNLDGVRFGAVVCYSTFPHFHDKPRALANIRRLLEPGGRVFICHSASRDTINTIHRNIPDFSDHLLPDNDAMAALLAGAGFSTWSIQSDVESYLVTAKK